MRITLLVTVDVRDEDVEQVLEENGDETLAQWAATEVQSALEFDGGVALVRVGTTVVEQLARTVDTLAAADLYDAAPRYRVQEAAEALVQWTRLEVDE